MSTKLHVNNAKPQQTKQKTYRKWRIILRMVDENKREKMNVGTNVLHLFLLLLSLFLYICIRTKTDSETDHRYTHTKNAETKTDPQRARAQNDSTKFQESLFMLFGRNVNWFTMLCIHVLFAIYYYSWYYPNESLDHFNYFFLFIQIPKLVNVDLNNFARNVISKGQFSVLFLFLVWLSLFLLSSPSIFGHFLLCVDIVVCACFWFLSFAL